MKTFYSLRDFLKSRAHFERFLITIGVFDGVHCAHQRLIKTLIRKAKKKNLSTLLITFDPHPANVLSKSPKTPLLISLKHRLYLLEEAGVDYGVVLKFTKKLSYKKPADFIENVLGKIPIDEIIVGKNFFFGRSRKGTLRDLRKFSKIYGYRISVIGTFKRYGKIISSTWIRNLILKGDLEKASRLLSRPVAILGTVIRGHKRGRIIGYPTANVDPHHEAIPPSGVYAVKTKLEKKMYKGILNIGVRPTFKGASSRKEEPTIEVHIFNFNRSIYGRDLEIIFVKKIRNEKKFCDVASLRRQIENDERFARRILR